MNERIEHAAAPDSRNDEHVFEFICECSNARCAVLPLRIAPYEEVRSDPKTFLLAPGNELPEIETVVSRSRGYEVVIKRCVATEIAEDRDPRG